MYEKCLRYTIVAKLSPFWNPLGDDFMAKGRDFLNEKIIGTVKLQYKVIMIKL